jgi:hypothetical protein
MTTEVAWGWDDGLAASPRDQLIRGEPMARIVDLTGQRFGAWTVLHHSPSDRKGAFWWCKCDCGTEKAVLGHSLRSNGSVSCGCLGRELQKAAITTHGMTSAPEFGVWTQIKSRCYNPRNASWQWYGGKGVKVCPQWLNSFEQFYFDMGPRPTPRHQIDRIDSDGDYEPSNCRWVTPTVNIRNRKNAQVFEIEGVVKPAVEWAAIYGISYTALMSRVRRGMDPLAALTRPYALGKRTHAPQASK